MKKLSPFCPIHFLFVISYLSFLKIIILNNFQQTNSRYSLSYGAFSRRRRGGLSFYSLSINSLTPFQEQNLWGISLISKCPSRDSKCEFASLIVIPKKENKIIIRDVNLLRLASLTKSLFRAMTDYDY